MRILFVTPWFPTLSSPISGVFVQRDAELVSTEHDVEVLHLVDPLLLSPDDLIADAELPLTVHRFPMSRASPVDAARAWRRIYELSRGIDLLHTQAFQSLIPFLGRYVDKPWVHSEHWSGVAEPDSLPWRERFIFRVTAGLLDRPEIVTAVSTHLQKRVRRHRTGVTMIVPSVVSEAKPTPQRRDPDMLRLVSVGGLVDGKDPVLAVKAIQELRRRGVNAELTWLGDGPLRDVVQDIITNDEVTLMGAVNRSGVSNALSDANIFLLPTRGETLCLSAIEAISHGRPVVIGDRGGQRDYVNDSNGRLVTPRTAAAYADAVIDVVDDLNRLTPESVASSIHGRFSPSRVLNGYVSAYEQAKNLHENRQR